MYFLGTNFGFFFRQVLQLFFLGPDTAQYCAQKLNSVVCSPLILLLACNAGVPVHFNTKTRYKMESSANCRYKIYILCCWLTSEREIPKVRSFYSASSCFQANCESGVGMGRGNRCGWEGEACYILLCATSRITIAPLAWNITCTSYKIKMGQLPHFFKRGSVP